MSVQRRLLQGVGANLVNQVLTIAQQLIMLPVFLGKWDPLVYGQWLILSAIPGAFAFADAGFLGAAANAMMFHVGRSEMARARVVLHSTVWCVLIFLAVLLSVGLTALAIIDAPEIASPDRKIALGLLMIYVVLLVLNGFSDGVFRAVGRYALGVQVMNASRVLEFVLSVIGLYGWGRFETVAAGLVLGKACTIAWAWRYIARNIPDLKIGVADRDFAEMRRLVRPALSFAVLPMTSALTIQGSILVAGALLGPVYVTVLSSTRTVTRALVQLMMVLSTAAWPELTLAIAQGNNAVVRRTLRWLYAIALGAGIPGALLLCVFGNTILQAWSHGKVHADVLLLITLTAAALVNGIAQVPRTLLLASNAHSGLAVASIVFAVLQLALQFALTSTFSHAAAGIATLFGELSIAIVCFGLTHRKGVDRIMFSQ
jgi:O-antigen/teichoic acid export membrane protein